MFARVIGQARAKKILQRAVEKDHLSHAYLFAGPHGIGKTTMAKELAMVLNCETGEGCGECSSCKRIGEGIYPDVKVIEPEGPTIKIDQIRLLCSFLAMSSYEGRYKVAIIRQAEKMREEAANSLLKTLEEPPADSLLILTAENQYALLPTILSRVQKVDFQKLTQAEITSYLINRGLSKEEALGLTEYSGGSLGKAIEIKDSESMRELYGDASKVVNNLQQLLPNEIIDISAKIGKDRLQTIRFLDILTDVIRTRSFNLKGNTKQDFGTVFGKEYAETQIAAILDYLEELKLYIEGYGNAQLALEGLFIRLRR